jgi:hypothetical protein
LHRLLSASKKKETQEEYAKDFHGINISRFFVEKNLAAGKMPALIWRML